MTVKRLIGSAPSQVSRNKDLGSMAWQNKEAISVGTGYFSGNVGIGTNSPGSKLDISSGNNTGGFRLAGATTGYLYGSVSNSGGQLIFGVGDASTGALFGGMTANASAIGSNTATPFHIATNGNVRATFDSSGNLGLGVTPKTWYTSYGTRAIQFAASGAIAGLDSSSSDRRVYLLNNMYANSVGSYEYINAGAASMYLQLAGAHQWHYAASGAAGATLTTTQAMTLDASGNLLVGDTVTGYRNTNSIFAQPLSLGAYIIVNHASGTVDGREYAIFGYNATKIGSITQSGTTAVAYNTVSDHRLKENIQPIQNALATVAQLNPVTYTWKADGSDGQGFIAHELQAVVPDCVTGEKDAVDADGNPVYQGIDTSFLVATLTKAIQELKAELDELKAKVN